MYASTRLVHYVVDSPQNKARKDINLHNRESFPVDCKTLFQSSMHLETCRTIVWGSLVTHRLVITIVNFASQLLNFFFFNLRSFFFVGGGMQITVRHILNSPGAHFLLKSKPAEM